MFKFLLIVLVFNKGDGNLEFYGIQPFVTKQECEVFIEKQLPPIPSGYRLSANCHELVKLDTTEAKVD